MSLQHLDTKTRRLIRSLKPFDVVEVIWEDVWSTIKVFSLADAQALPEDSPFIRNTLGYVVRADDEYLVVAGTDDRNAEKNCGEVADPTILRTGYILDVKLLRRDK